MRLNERWSKGEKVTGAKCGGGRPAVEIPARPVMSVLVIDSIPAEFS